MFGRVAGCIDQLSVIERAAIVTLHGCNWTRQFIAQTLRTSVDTVSLWINRWDTTRSLDDADRSGRPRCTTDEQDQDIVMYSDEHVTATPKDIVRELQLDVHPRTVRNRLNEVGLYSCVQQTEIDNPQRRLSWARGYAHFTEADWSTVLFSDETHFYLGHQSREYVQRPLGAALDPKYTHHEAEHLQGKVSLWGCISVHGLGHAEIYVDQLNSKRYQDILKGNLVASARTFWPNSHWWFQQDNWSVHTSQTSRQWFDMHGIDLIEWPAWSPDLNPIEELWSDIKHRVYSRHPQTMEELEAIIGEEWQATDLHFIARICGNMPHRLKAVIENEGHKIAY